MQTISDLFHSSVGLNLEHALMYKHAGQWLSISSRELERKVTGVARALLSWRIAPGERVAILSENRPEWMIADLAIMCLGAVTVPIYPTLTPEQIAWLLRNSDARVLFLSPAEQLQKFWEIRAHVPVERVAVMDADAARSGTENMGDLMQGSWQVPDAEFEARRQAVKPDELATIIYTSGTTGEMKGVMLTHRNLASNEECSLA